MDELLTPDEVARILKVSAKTLRKWRMRRYGPRWIKLGGASSSLVRYTRQAIDDYLASIAAP